MLFWAAEANTTNNIHLVKHAYVMSSIPLGQMWHFLGKIVTVNAFMMHP